VGTNFDQVMKQQGRKATWLASVTGVSPATVTRIRKGQRNPSPEFRAKAAAALEVDEAELFPELAAGAA
jgi:transcriptional regulator with XRE-family HTH domain